MRRLCVFLGSAEGTDPACRAATASLGTALAEREITLVYGGASVGLMGVLADAVLGAGGRAIGVMPRRLVGHELAHRGLSELRVVESLHERKAAMADLADAFFALPGGLGTLEELLEAATMTQLGFQAKPCGLLNVRGFFDPLLAMLDHAVDSGFIAPRHREIILAESELPTLFARLSAWQAPPAKRARLSTP